MKYRWIVTDFDGTLKHSGDYISEANITALKEFHKRGGHVVIATARPLYGIRKYFSSLPFIDYVILCNGAWIWDIRNKKTLFAKPLETAVLHYLVFTYWNEERFNFMMAGMDKTVINRYSKDPQLMEYQKILRSKKYSSDELLFSQRKIYNIEVSASHKELEVMSNHLLSRFPGKVTTGFSWTDFIEVYSAETSKGEAMRFLAKHLAIQTKEVLAFGDGDNDIALFEAAGTSVAMANATENLRKKAGYATLHYNEDGVAHYLNSFVLTGG